MSPTTIAAEMDTIAILQRWCVSKGWCRVATWARRVDCIGGRTGRGKGRREWEWTYYRDEIIALELLEICR